jgi:hypothetical protein
MTAFGILLAIESKLRGCDLVKLKIGNVVSYQRVDSSVGTAAMSGIVPTSGEPARNATVKLRHFGPRLDRCYIA